MDYEVSKDPNTAIWEYLPEYANLTPAHLRQAVFNHCVQIMTPNDGFHDLEVLWRVKKLLGAVDEGEKKADNTMYLNLLKAAG